jgi:type IV pilus secretin PilQ/predicted competence protein
MFNHFKHFICGTAALLGAITLSEAQIGSPTPASKLLAAGTLQTAPSADSQAKPATSPALPAAPSAKTSDNSPLTLVQASTINAAPPPTTSTKSSTTSTTTSTTSEPAEADSATDNGGVGVREFQGDDVGQVLRLLARQSKINMVVTDQLPKDSAVTMRLEDVTALQAIEIIVKAKGLFMDKIDNVYYVKTPAEREKEPTESDSYQFSYAQVAIPATPQGEKLMATTSTTGTTAGVSSSMSAASSMTTNTELFKLIKSQLQSGVDPQFDFRTNTVFYRETRSNIDNIRKLLVQIDKPTKQVMIEARLVEVSANPQQAYGINWGGVVGSASNPKNFNFGGSTLGTNKLVDAQTVIPGVGGAPPTLIPRLDANGIPVQGTNVGTLPAAVDPPINFLRDVSHGFGALGSQFAILSVPQMNLTLQALNEDSDAEFLANPRVVTADNMPAKIEIVRAQPVPTLSFDAQTAQSVFNGFQDKTFGNTLLVRPSVNKENFVTLAVKPIISNKVSDATFTFQGSTVTSPVIDTRSLDSNVLIKSGDTLAIGGLMQDEVTKSRTKVPVVGDVPILGYLFQSRSNIRVKRNLLVFVTPTIIDQHYGTGLEDQVSGLHHSGEEYADPNGWRNNAKGAVRLVPTSNRQNAAAYPKPGIPPAPARDSTTTTSTTDKVQFMSTAKDRDL